MCNAPVLSDGVITVTWSYIHTGGLPLIYVSVTYYIFTEDSKTITHPVSVSDTDTTSIEIPDLVAGFEYTFNITTKNSNGYSSTLCGPIVH